MSSRLCLFCPNPLSCNTSPEHILLDALGGRATTRRVICTSCNNHFGSTIDKAFAKQIESTRTLLNLQSGSKKTPPNQRFKSATGDAYIVRPDGAVVNDGKPITFTHGANGAIKVSLNVETWEDVSKFIPNIAAKTGVSEEQVRRQMETAEARRISQAAPPFKTDLSFGGHDPLRSIVKSCMVLCASKTDLESTRGLGYAAARSFVKHGSEEFLNNEIVLEEREIPNIELLERDYGPIFNIIFCKSDTTGRMTAYYGLYNTAYWHIVLAKSGARLNQTFGVISDPREPSHWSHFDAKRFDLDVSWLSCPTVGGSDRIKKSLAVAFAQRDENMREDHLRSIIHETMQDCGIQYGDVITQEFCDILAQRTAFWIMRSRHEQLFSATQIKTALDQIATRKK